MSDNLWCSHDNLFFSFLFLREYDVLLLNSGMGDIDIQTKTKELLHVSAPGATEDAGMFFPSIVSKL